MRRHHWFIAALLLLGLWAWTQRSHNGSLHAPPAPAPTAAVAVVRSPPVPTVLAPRATPPAGQARRYPAFLPREAAAVLDDIARGGPYDYRQDGNVFQNRERRLPPQPQGYYREFTVPTPGADDRGPRRIVTGGGTGKSPPREYWYSGDHYRTFRRFDVDDGTSR